ncbi:hypothetical protein AQ490_11550 [Wenjunlia vitaminophila]|uniref:AraC effector-binding domain-containing protein n=1 Tax=Wenjunlia vitaminophila TaxID=76728 RepID=A0A0T6LKG2_WENVI|nr:GyrI-like domain-containing protein [Wenjunlia vitaminophila]KRV46520.1 hypothetical protein AQ490_11550 [Wenjunlia vitaminophila]
MTVEPTSAGPRVEIRSEQPCVAISVTTTPSEWGGVGTLVIEALEWLAARGLTPAGAPFLRHRLVGDGGRPFRLEIGWPVEAPVEGAGRVVAGVIPAGRYAVLVHAGHPDRLPESCKALELWGADRGLEWDVHRDGAEEVWGGRFEFYLTDPAERPDPEEWLTEIAYRVRDEPAG